MTRAGQRIVQAVMMTLCIGGSAVVLDTARARDGDTQTPGRQRSGVGAQAHPRGDHRHGEELYNASCVVCHGPGATGGIGPRLAGNPVLSNEQAFEKVLTEGRHMMPPLKDTLTGQQLADIQAWLKTLR